MSEIEKQISVLHELQCKCVKNGFYGDIGLAEIALQEKQEREHSPVLSLEELRQMDTMPVYCVGIKNKGLTGYGLVCSANNEIIDSFCDLWQFDEYGKEYVAYAHKPKQGENQ